MPDATVTPVTDPFHAHALVRWGTDGGREPDGDDTPRPVTTTRAGVIVPRVVLPRVGKGPASGLNPKSAVVGKPVYRTLADHQKAETDWDYNVLSAFLDDWFDRFNDRLALNLPRVPLRLDPKIRRNCAGYFLPGHNEFGLAYEIAVAVPPPEALAAADRAELLGTLLHEQLHLLQELTGVPGHHNYHNAAYRRSAERFGLLVDHRGHQTYAADGPFLDLLSEFGIEPPPPVRHARAVALGHTPPPPAAAKPRRAGRSKLKKWTCGCTNVWVGVSELVAACRRPECGRPYARA